LKKKDKPILFVVIDNLRYDQWKFFESVVNDYYKLEKNCPTTILPTATQYAKCDFLWFIAVEMEKQFPQYWKNDPEKVKLI
jgi:hypothetical protein